METEKALSLITYQDLKFELKSTKHVEHTNWPDERFSTKPKTNKKTPSQRARDTKRMKTFQARKREERKQQKMSNLDTPKIVITENAPEEEGDKDGILE